VTGPRPVFRLHYEGLGELKPRRLRFRITLEPLASDGKRYVFDQRRRGNGWLLGDEGEVLYRTTKPIEDGRYRWQVASWNGVEWTGGGQSLELRIDAVPPADVEGLTVRFDAAQGEVRLDWQPVSLDRHGRPEFVDRYHVYRYDRRSFPRGAREHEVGVVDVPHFIDRGLPAEPSKILFYRVTAEDTAGNEPGRRN
jgi:hypothetical protein